MKKSLKIWLITWASILVAWWARAWLTKAWIIPNWLGIELLCPWNNAVNLSRTYDRKDPQCSEKCNKGCEKHEDEPFWYLCWNNCITKCYIPKRENCLNNCETLGILSEWYESCKYSCWPNPSLMLAAKPIIYLYPTKETEIHVELWTPENLSHTYPKYNSEKWRNVIAQPNGDLEDIETWRKLYAQYREWKSDIKTNFDEWFVVAWKDIISFLEEKLAILWLNEREAEEFIVYWLPQMENNEWNLIRFETKAEQDENMPLNITPIPNTIIRIMMDWKAINEPIDIPEQQLTTPERSGFTVVEWWWSPRK